MPHLFIFGFGYTASFVAKAALAQGWQVSGTTRDPAKATQMRKNGVIPVILTDTTTLDLSQVTHLLSSVPPTASGDPVLQAHNGVIAAASQLQWIGYLSTTGVYGDHQGAWVDETTPCHPTSPRSQWRLAAEQAWQGLPLPAHIFRLAGIYGPGRNVIEDLRRGAARRIDKPGHVFNRIHVEDIAQALLASMAQPHPGEIYNLADDEPASSREVVEFAAKLLGIEPPPLEDYAPANLSEMAKSFYEECKRVGNEKIKLKFGLKLNYYTYKKSLTLINDIIQISKDIFTCIQCTGIIYPTINDRTFVESLNNTYLANAVLRVRDSLLHESILCLSRILDKQAKDRVCLENYLNDAPIEDIVKVSAIENLQLLKSSQKWKNLIGIRDGRIAHNLDERGTKLSLEDITHVKKEIIEIMTLLGENELAEKTQESIIAWKKIAKDFWDPIIQAGLQMKTISVNNKPTNKC